MSQYRIVRQSLDILLCLDAILLLGCSLFPLCLGESDLVAFLVSGGLTLVVGLVLFLLGRGADKKVNRKDGYIIVTFSWVLFATFGMLPFLVGRYTDSVANAFLETMSGFTTTGATIFDDIESLPHGILFWRSLTQWFGGLGIVFFTIAVLPIFGSGGMKLFAAETTGPTHSKLHPRLDVTGKWIWTIYLIITITHAALLVLGDMPLFDSVCTAMSTAATGGLSVKQSSIEAYHSPYIEYITTLFMLISGLNFTLLYVAILKRKPVRLLKDTEFRWYVGSYSAFTLFVTVALLVATPMGLEQSFRLAAFQVASLQTTTGFVTTDYMMWPSCTWLVLCIAMIVGACAGSTSGAIKSIRLAMLCKIVRNQFRHMLHPNAVLPLRINGVVIPEEIKATLLAFFFTYMGILLLGWLYMLSVGVGFMEGFGITVSSLGNVGPGLGSVGPAYSWNSLPDAAKWGCSVLMLIGRLELFSVLLLFSPSFWRKH